MPEWKRTARAQSAATPEAIWSVLLDGRAWSQWYPGVSWMVLEGAVAPGALITVKPKRWQQTALRISVVQPAERLAFGTHLGPLAAFTMTFNISPQPGAGTDVVLAYQIAGPLANLVVRIVGTRLESGIDDAVTALAIRASEGVENERS